MCGIAGTLSTREIGDGVLAMMNAIAHRGPDDSGIAMLRGASGARCGAFGHRRLAILDPSPAGHQPMATFDRRYLLTYNGEIYNHETLRRELASEGAQFRSRCDTEVVLAGWALHGPAFLPRLRGMFAFAIWDSLRERCSFVRDTFGVKPLYIGSTGADVHFASELRALLVGGVPRDLSARAVRGFLETGSVPEPETIVENVASLPPGCFAEAHLEGERWVVTAAVAYAEPFLVEPANDTDVASGAARIRDALRDSVKHHLVSDVPVGVFLSGGIDSTAIAGLASEIAGSGLDTFTLTFAETDYSEAALSRLAARKFSTRHHEIPFTGTQLLHTLPAFFSAMDQPSIDGLNTYVLSRAVRAAGIKVVLSGLGGDELFAGYPSFRRARLIAPLWQLPRIVRTSAASALPGSWSGRAEKLKAMLEGQSAAEGAYLASRILFGQQQREALMSTTPSADVAQQKLRQSHGEDTLRSVSAYELSGYMRNTLLRDSDVFSMAHSLELRVPFVDRELARAAMSTAERMMVRGRMSKPLLVEAVRDLLSPELLSQPKRGFTIPFERWMRQEMHAEVERTLSTDEAARSGLRSSAVAEVWRQFNSRQHSVNWSRPWALYTLLRWTREHGVYLREPRFERAS